MSNLDNFHPFRQSVNLKDGSSSNQMQPAQSGSQDNQGGAKDKDDIEYNPLLSWKTKLRLLIGAFAVSLMFYIFSSASSILGPLLEPFGRNAKSNNVKLEHIEEPQSLVFDKNDLNERGREVGHARKKAGFFASMFCKGGKKSSFCE